MSDLDPKLGFLDMQWLKKGTLSHLGIAEIETFQSSSFLPKGNQPPHPASFMLRTALFRLLVKP